MMNHWMLTLFKFTIWSQIQRNVDYELLSTSRFWVWIWYL